MTSNGIKGPNKTNWTIKHHQHKLTLTYLNLPLLLLYKKVLHLVLHLVSGITRGLQGLSRGPTRTHSYCK